MAFFDDFDWGAVAKSVGMAIPSIVSSGLGAYAVSRANDKAAGMAQQAGTQNAAVIREAADRGAVARAPAMAHFRAVAGSDPGVITPVQQVAIDDTMRNFNNKNLLGTVGGRSFSRMHADTVGRMRAGAVKENTARVDSAANQMGNLAGQETNANMQVANAQVGNTNNVVNAMGNAVTGTGTATADTFGQIANVFANATKDEDRKSRYAEYDKSRR